MLAQHPRPSLISGHDRRYALREIEYRGAKAFFDKRITLQYNETTRYTITAISENGTELNAILPKMSPLNPKFLAKKQSVFNKIATFVEKFKGVGGKI